MHDNLHCTPANPFSADLSVMPDEKLQVLDTQVQRQLDREIVDVGETDPETEFRHYELDEEFDERGKR